jgi:hypothetical protein
MEIHQVNWRLLHEHNSLACLMVSDVWNSGYNKQRKSEIHKLSIPGWKSIYRVLENGDADFVIRRGCVWSRRGLPMVNESPSSKSKHVGRLVPLVVIASCLTRRLEADSPRAMDSFKREKKKLAYFWRYWSLFLFKYIHISYLWFLISHASMPQCLQ